MRAQVVWEQGPCWSSVKPLSKAKFSQVYEKASLEVTHAQNNKILLIHLVENNLHFYILFFYQKPQNCVLNSLAADFITKATIPFWLQTGLQLEEEAWNMY